MAGRQFELFLESEVFGCETFRAEGWKEAITTLKELFHDAEEYAEEDGIERKVGFIISGDDDPETEEEGEL